MKYAFGKPLARSALPLIGALSLALVSGTTMADSKDPKFTMTVFEDAPQGARIVAGKYVQAIDKIEARGAKNDAIRVETNLCVAYVKAGDVAAAEKSCDAAITAVTGQKRFTRYAMGAESANDARRRYLAIALSNRGVIKAVKGDFESARKDFDEALQLNTRLAAAKINLQRLGVEAESPA